MPLHQYSPSLPLVHVPPRRCRLLRLSVSSSTTCNKFLSSICLHSVLNLSASVTVVTKIEQRIISTMSRTRHNFTNIH